jgi:hypothetical protein
VSNELEQWEKDEAEIKMMLDECPILSPEDMKELGDAVRDVCAEITAEDRDSNHDWKHGYETKEEAIKHDCDLTGLSKKIYTGNEDRRCSGMSEPPVFNWDRMSWNACDDLHRLICPELHSHDGAREYYMSNLQLGSEIEQTIADLRKAKEVRGENNDAT